MTAGYSAALESAAWFDLSGTGIIRAAGPDAAAFLNNIGTNDIAHLPAGGGCDTFFCDHRARVLFHANVRRTADAFILDTASDRGESLLRHVDKYLISEAVELEDITSDWRVLHLAGPIAAAIIGRAAESLPAFHHASGIEGLPDGETTVRRRDLLRVPGLDLFVKSEHHAALVSWLGGRGAVAATPGDLEVLRIEAGVPVAGIDYDESRFVMEVADAARAVCYTKGCFIGQEPIVMARDRAGQINRLFLGLKVLDGGPPPPGTKLSVNGSEVGLVTSSTVSPRLGAPLALGYVRRPHIEPRTLLHAGSQPVEILGYPPLGDRSGR